MDQYAKAVIEAADRWLVAVDEVMDASEAARTNSEAVVALAAAVKEWRQNRRHFSIFGPHNGTEAQQQVVDLPIAGASLRASRPAASAAAAVPAAVLAVGAAVFK